jgi:DMSO/TMAO reductase YedYZ heme-binding membrane subunit
MQTVHNITVRFWQEVFIFSVAVSGLWGLYVFGTEGEAWSALFVAKVLAGTAGILLAGSLGMSSICYFFDFADSKIIYRKYLGLWGYLYALAYTVVIALLFPERYLVSFPQNLFNVDAGLGFLSMAIFTGMALISNSAATRLLGGQRWRNLLRFGYVAYALLVVRGIVLDAAEWQEFFTTYNSWPSVRMILTVLGLLVLTLRLTMAFFQWQESQEKNND